MPVLAAEAARPDDSWRFEFTPYVWGAGLDGTVRINDRPRNGLSVDQSFSDILDKLDFAAMALFEARTDRWGILLDGVYFKVSETGSVSGPRGFVSVSADAEITQQLYSLAAAYRVAPGRNPVDLYGGLRYASIRWKVDTGVSLPILGTRGRQLEDTKDWVDPFIGARGKYALNERWSLVGFADIGGFGAGSDLTWEVYGGAHWAFSPTVTGKFGYRYISIDYDKDDFAYDMGTGGFFVGLGIGW